MCVVSSLTSQAGCLAFLSPLGYYNGTIFHRVVRDFIIQGGDPTGTGAGGESVYGRPFKVRLPFTVITVWELPGVQAELSSPSSLQDEFHSRLRFNRRGLVAMANAGPNDNGSQFFFTLGRADELNNKHTIFGKVRESQVFSAPPCFLLWHSPGACVPLLQITGDTVYNMLRLSEVACDGDERPLNPHKIRTAEVPSPPASPSRLLQEEASTLAPLVSTGASLSLWWHRTSRSEEIQEG